MTDITILCAPLQQFGLTEFINQHYDYLYKKTKNHEILGKELLKLRIIPNENRLANCMQPPGHADRNERFYEDIKQKDDVLSFLEALKVTGNDHIINYILRALPEQQQLPVNEESIQKQPELPQGVHSLQKQLETLVQTLEENDVDLPLYEFFRPNISELLQLTNNEAEFKEELEKRIEGLKAEDLRQTYTAVFLSDEIEALVQAWKNSKNEDLINKTEKWLSNFRDQQ
ncbi:unnamed protein product [Allacma fusca]|uniref:Uncharacterized protein n=1 Tax=Allacma fusca TaxID=39272 RepID=A0A8J2KDS5_9HEXA|nr:unnamed protein product [Allacma fusca]